MDNYCSTTLRYICKKHSFIQDKYDTNLHTLSTLNEGTHVAVQELHKKHRKWWVKTDEIVEVFPNWQYHVKIDGSVRVTLRNHMYLKPTLTVNNPHKKISEICLLHSGTIVVLSNKQWELVFFRGKH